MPLYTILYPLIAHNIQLLSHIVHHYLHLCTGGNSTSCSTSTASPTSSHSSRCGVGLHASFPDNRALACSAMLPRSLVGFCRAFHANADDSDSLSACAASYVSLSQLCNFRQHSKLITPYLPQLHVKTTDVRETHSSSFSGTLGHTNGCSISTIIFLIALGLNHFLAFGLFSPGLSCRTFCCWI